MLITVDKLNLEFDEDIIGMKEKLSELTRLQNAIENSAHYKLLSGKTQMIGKGRGVSKKERSRMVHTSQIAYGVVEDTISKIYDIVLKNNPDLESPEFQEMFELNKNIAITRGLIMAKAHDIGHVAAGHEGENAINDFMGTIKFEEIQSVLDEHRRYFGDEYERDQGHIVEDDFYSESLIPRVQSLSFEHNELSATLLNQIIEKNGIELNEEDVRKLTLGVLGHSTSRTPIQLLDGDLEAQIVRVADKVEYINADYDEISSLLKIDASMDRTLLAYLQKPMKDRLKETTTDLAEEACRIGHINETHATMRRLARVRNTYKDIIYLYDGAYADRILKELVSISNDPAALSKYYAEHKGVEALYPPETVEDYKENRKILRNALNLGELEVDDAFQSCLTEQVHLKSVMQGENSDRIHFIYQRILEYYYAHPEEIPTKVTRTVNPIDVKQSKEFTYSLNPGYTNLQRTLEYISLMDDEIMYETYKDLVEERIDKGPGHGVEPVRMDEIKSYLRCKYDQEATKLVQKEELGTRTYEEARNLCSKKSKEYYSTKLTDEGKEAMKKYYQLRFEEYDEDFKLLQRMERADQERTILALPGEVIETGTVVEGTFCIEDIGEGLGEPASDSKNNQSPEDERSRRAGGIGRNRGHGKTGRGIFFRHER